MWRWPVWIVQGITYFVYSKVNYNTHTHNGGCKKRQSQRNLKTLELIMNKQLSCGRLIITKHSMFPQETSRSILRHDVRNKSIVPDVWKPLRIQVIFLNNPSTSNVKILCVLSSTIKDQ